MNILLKSSKDKKTLHNQWLIHSWQAELLLLKLKEWLISPIHLNKLNG